MSEDTPGRGVELQKTVHIKDQEYKITLFGPTRAIKMAVKLIKLLGEPFVTMAMAKGKKEEAIAMLPVAIRALTERIDEDEIVALLKDLMTSVTQKNKMLNFEEHFHGKLGVLLRLTSKTMEVQFGDFLEEIGLMMEGMDE